MIKKQKTTELCVVSESFSFYSLLLKRGDRGKEGKKEMGEMKEREREKIVNNFWS